MTVSGQQRDQRAHSFCTWCGAPRHGAAPYCASCGQAHGLEVPSEPAAEPWEDTVVTASAQPEGTAVQDPWPWDSLRGTDESETSVLPTSAARRDAKPAWLRSRWVAVVAALVMVSVIAWAGFVGAGYLRDRPVHTALESTARAYRPLVVDLASANDFTDVQDVAATADRTVARLQQQHADLRDRSGTLAARATDLVGVQVAVSEAFAGLAELDEQSLSSWGGLHAGLSEAVRRESRARAQLRAVDVDAAARLPDGREALANVREIVGQTIAASASEDTAILLDQVTSARTTADVRTVATDAAATGESLEAARAGVDPQSAEGEQLSAAGEVLTQLARLSSLDGDNLEVWSSVQAPLESAVLALAATDSGLDGRAGDDSAVEALDKLVRRAERRLAEWQATYNAAVEDRAEDLDALADYADSMRVELNAYDELRAETSDFVDGIESATYDEAYAELSRGADDRAEVRADMDGLTVPDEVATAHDGVVTILDDAIDAMYAAYDGLFDSQWCTTSCFYNRTPAWREFSSESDRITGDFDSATAAWESAVAAAETSIRDRRLPVKPQV